MAISNKKIKTTQITVGDSTSELLVKDNESSKNKRTYVSRFNNFVEEVLSLDELKFLKDDIKNNSNLLTKIVEISSSSRKFFESNTVYEQIFEDAKNLTLEKVGFFAVNFRNQLTNKTSFRQILKSGENNFEYWFHNFIEYTLLVRLADYYNQTIASLSDIRGYNVLLTDIEVQRKSTIRFIKENLLDNFKEFLYYEWKKALIKNVEYDRKRNLAEKTILIG